MTKQFIQAKVILQKQETVRISWQGNRETEAVNKLYLIKFSGSEKAKEEYRRKFEKFIEERGAKYSIQTDDGGRTYYPKDDYSTGEWHCMCQAMSDFLNIEHFEFKGLGNILEVYQKEIEV